MDNFKQLAPLIDAAEHTDELSSDSFLLPETSQSVIPWPGASPMLGLLNEGLMPPWWDD